MPQAMAAAATKGGAGRRRADSGASRRPPVPKAPRTAARPQSAGSLARDAWSRRPESVRRSSSRARSRESDCRSDAASVSSASSAAPAPRSGLELDPNHGRVQKLSREDGAFENQQFKFGPQRRAPVVGHVHERQNRIERERASNAGMPWSAPREDTEEQDAVPHMQCVARRNVLRNEAVAAEQALEIDSLRWASRERQNSASAAPGVTSTAAAAASFSGVAHACHGRVSHLAREEGLGGGESLAGIIHGPRFVADCTASRSSASSRPGSGSRSGAARRSVLDRESATESYHTPHATGVDTKGLPTYGRRQMLFVPPPSSNFVARTVTAH